MPALRFAAIGAFAAGMWLTTAAQTPGHVRLPVMAVVAGAVVTQPFGCTTVALEPVDPFCATGHIHTGIDLAAPQGTEVHAATGGVAHIGFDPNGAGLYVAIAFDAHVRLLYCHLSATRVVEGARVTPGELIGLVGSTGLATGPHVHFEIQVDGTAVDPVRWLSS